MNKRTAKMQREHTACAIKYMEQNTAKSIAEYAVNTISLPESRRWDYAIPENYTNYRDGFLYQDSKPYRGQPLMNYNGTILYLYLILDYWALEEHEAEKYLLFDRHGNKYTFVTTKEPETPGGNPSYFEFLPRVKKYAPTRAAIIRERLKALKGENT